VTVIGAVAAKAEETMDIDGAPEYIAADGKGAAWVNVADKDAVATIDRHGKLTRTTSLPGCKQPTALAIDCQKGRLVVGCRNNVLAIVDTSTLKVLARLPIREHVDATEFDPDLSSLLRPPAMAM
jgi:sugar lactone lactonase YvrE